MPKPPRPTTPRRPGSAPKSGSAQKSGPAPKPGPARKTVATDDAPPPRADERIAKVLARAGVASRREAETIIAAGRVAVNGTVIDSPALNVGPRDRVTVDGKPLAAPEPARLWLYHKPAGLVTTERDEKGRPTVFAALPEGMPRVMSVGRLDLNSEGLLLLTNDGELKRRLELPATGWLRKYRVRVKGTPADATLAPLRQGITIEGERFQPMAVSLDRQQGANAWLTVGIREGRNREVRRAMEAVGLVVNRLIRVGYGPFQLGDLAPGAVEEVRAKVLRDQLGLAGPEADTPRRSPPDAATRAPRPGRAPTVTEAGARRSPKDTTAPATGGGLRGKAGGRIGGASGSRSPVAGAKAPASAPVSASAGAKARTAPGGRPGAAARARTALDDEMTTAKPARRSWGAKSHGGPARPRATGPEGAPGGAPDKPRSWGSKRATPSTTPPRRPGKGPKTPR